MGQSEPLPSRNCLQRAIFRRRKATKRQANNLHPLTEGKLSCVKRHGRLGAYLGRVWAKSQKRSVYELFRVGAAENHSNVGSEHRNLFNVFVSVRANQY